MSQEKEDPKDRLDKAMGEMKELQRKFDAMTPEQKDALGKKMKAHEHELRGLMGKLGAAYNALNTKQKTGPNRVAVAIVEKTSTKDEFRAMKSRRELGLLWGDGWLVPIAFFGKKSALKQGKGIKAFWAAIMEVVPDKNDTLVALGDAWKSSPTLALPAALTQLSSLLLDHFGPDLENRILPFNLTSEIITRIVIEIQIQAGSDPADTAGLEVFLNDLNLVAAGESPIEEPKDLTLKVMLAFGWLASILASEKK